jgi:hypothetical protein
VIVAPKGINKKGGLVGVACSTACPPLDTAEGWSVRPVNLISEIACRISPDNAVANDTITMIYATATMIR